jgi:hypothetical protein
MTRVLYIQQHGFELNLSFEESSHMVALGSKFRADDEEEEGYFTSLVFFSTLEVQGLLRP